MSTLKRRERAQKIKNFIQAALIYSVIGAILAITYFQYQLVQMLDRVLEQDAAEQAEGFEPLTDPCTLAFVDCAEAHTEPKAEPSAEAEALRKYLISKGGDELAVYAEEIVKLDRWQDAVAIAWKETHFCTRGVGASKNNCGGIKSSIEGRTFKHYENVYDSVWDINYLLNKPRFKDKSIAELNGIYCVNEAAGGGACPNWTEVITGVKAELAQLK